MRPKAMISYFIVLVFLALLMAALIPEIEAQDDRINWEPSVLRTATATSTSTAGWYDELPTPAYGAPSETPDLTLTATATPEATEPIPTPTVTFGLQDVLITLTARAER